MTHHTSRSRMALAWLLVAALMAVGLAACGGSDDSDEASADEPAADAGSDDEAAPVRGGSLNYVHQSDPRSLDPIAMTIASSAGGQVMFFNAYGALLLTEPDGSISPLLADSLETSDDGLSWELKLRPELAFSDGTPFDAEAVKFNWDRHADPANASAAAGALASVESYEVVDAQTISITLKKANTNFPSIVANSALSYIASPTGIQAAGDDFGTAPIGAGPFVLKEWVEADHSTWVRNETYFDAENVYLDEIVIRPISDDTQKVNLYRTNAADLVWGGTASAFDEMERAGAEVTEFAVTGGIGVMFNVAREPFDDVGVRTALLQAMDRDALAEAYTGTKVELGHGFLAEGSPFYNPDARYPAPDLEAAQAAIADHVAANGPIEIDVLYVSGPPTVLNLVTVLKAQLERVDGVKVQLNGVDLAALVSTWRAGDWDVSFNGASGVVFDPSMYDLLHSEGGRNFSGYSNAKVDAALERARGATDEAEARAAYDEVQMEVTADAYFPPYIFSVYRLAATPKVHLEAFGDGVPRFDRIWVEE